MFTLSKLEDRFCNIEIRSLPLWQEVIFFAYPLAFSKSVELL